MPSALELVREVRDLVPEDDPARTKLDAALAEMERDQGFIEAAEEFTPWFFITDKESIGYAPVIQRLIAAYRARREERGKHGE